jgi:hypothetical protein
LLELLAFLGTARVGGRKRGELGHHAEQPRVRSGAGAHGREVAAQEQQQSCLARLIGVLPDPGAFAVGGAESAGHRFAERARIERRAAFERVEKSLRRQKQARCGAGIIRGWRRGGQGKRGLGGVFEESHGRAP